MTSKARQTGIRGLLGDQKWQSTTTRIHQGCEFIALLSNEWVSSESGTDQANLEQQSPPFRTAHEFQSHHVA